MPVKDTPIREKGSRIDPPAGRPPSVGQLIDFAKLVDADYILRPVPPTPTIAQAILVHNRGRKDGLEDGNVVTSSHNPPEDRVQSGSLVQLADWLVRCDLYCLPDAALLSVSREKASIRRRDTKRSGWDCDANERLVVNGFALVSWHLS
jgi:hypothetical protein